MQPQSPNQLCSGSSSRSSVGSSVGGTTPVYPYSQQDGHRVAHQYSQYYEGASSHLSRADVTEWKHTTDTLKSFVEQRGQEDSQEPSGRDISTSHWKKSSERSHCSNPKCRRKFTITGRKHHCRRCGEVFCNKCLKFQRRLSARADYDPNGKLYQVCEVCYNSDTQTIGRARIWTKTFEAMRSTYQAGVNSDSLKYGNPTKVILQQECARLVDGYRRHFLSIKSTAQEDTNNIKPKSSRFSFPRLGSKVPYITGVPDWQKPATWMSEGPECKVCSHAYTRLEKYHNCRICGRLVCLSCSSRNFLLYVPDDCDRERLGNQPRWAIIAIVGCPEVEPTQHMYLRVCDPCREKLETLQVEAYQEWLQEGDETVDCMARLIQMHKDIVAVQKKIEVALPEYKQLIDGMEIAPESPKSLPSQRSNMQVLAKNQGDLSDNFTKFVVMVGRLKQLKPQSSKQLKLFKSVISCKFSFYSENMYQFRQLKKRLAQLSPPEVLQEIQEMVDSEAINSACLCIGQLAFEALHLCTKYDITEKYAMAIAIKEAAEVCECDLEANVNLRGREDWQDHKKALDSFIKHQLSEKNRRYLRPSRRLTHHYRKSYVEVFLVRRCEEVVGQIYLQLKARCADRRFEKSKTALSELKETLASPGNTAQQS